MVAATPGVGRDGGRRRMRHLGRAAAAVAVVALLAVHAAAQSLPTLDPDLPVTLVADSVIYDSTTGRVTAAGSVEVYYGNRTLTADEIVFDSRTERIEAQGNIVLRDPSGATVFADIADLDADLRDGLIQGARLAMGENMRLSAVEARRSEQRFNALSRAVYSPCNVCPERPTPLWQIRARRIVHDELAQRIYYEDATFDLFGVPVAFTPFFSHPDPTTDRATGFLAPSFKQSSNYGYGVRQPFYWVIDEQSDLTVAPFITTDERALAEAEYRRAFSNGFMRVGGSLTVNEFSDEEEIQGHLDTDAEFRLPQNLRLGWDVKAVTDDAYLRFYDLSNEDRLTSEIYARAYGERSYMDATGVYFQSLRDNEPAGQIPLALPDFDARYALGEPVLGGELGFELSNVALIRNNGPDSARFSIGADWERETILPMGVALRGFAEVRGDIYATRGDPLRDDTQLRLAPLAGVEARYPLIYEQSAGVAHVLEPIAQAIVAPYGGNDIDIPNEDSLVTEFDETNLFSASHFSGVDGFEEGPRFNLGLRYERIVSDGIRFDGTIGRVLRLRDAEEFSAGSGLSEAQSDWVASWAVGYDPYVTVRQRVRFGNQAVTRNEVLADFALGPVELSTSYIFLESDPEIGAPDDREELAAGSRVTLTPNWQVGGFLRRDLEVEEFVELRGGVTYMNECCAIDLVVGRRFTDSEDAPAATTVGVQVRLITLGSTAEEASIREPFSLWQ